MSSARILVVDDHPTNLKLACDVLETAGFEVRRAADAESALHALACSLPDLILVDINLPGMDGLALTRRLKEQVLTQQIPIIALTALAMKGDDKKAFDAGCDGYIAKPIDTRTFPARVAAVLQRVAAKPLV